ncbi:MAG: Asp-tRNA(Asn)/Glu-tRNA(Gln) amidotransferase subunit GatB [Saprospiraceae bacterium]|jgi:aspartyl-tRNA(Asn)/glutamyl-tRNA(Gln) amidotransferase subunit B
MVAENYEVVIGLEVHVQLATKSKAFCSDSTEFGSPPNTQVSPISLGHPGTLPRVNEKQIKFAVELGLALGCKINRVNRFDRKNYFYADLPKGYQITQDAEPICIGGQLGAIRLHHIHMEEDAGKSMHSDEGAFSVIDLNRAGVPLLEIVTEPDFRSAEEVETFMVDMRRMVRYLGVSDGNMEQGSMRCDCNVSVRKKGAHQLGERCEIKNLNSMRYAKKAIEYEFNRQVQLMENGESVVRQTLHFDPQSGITTPIREKEDANDYRYFPDPDLCDILISDDFLDDIKANMPLLPEQMRNQLIQEYHLSEYDANLISEDPEVAHYYLSLVSDIGDLKGLSKLLINKIIPYCNESKINISNFPLSGQTIADFLELIQAGTVSNSAAYQFLFPELIEKAHDSISPESLAKELNLIQESDENLLEDLVIKLLASYPDKVKAYKNGKKGLIGFFMGEVMKKTKGKADPKKTSQMFKAHLDR